MIYFGHTEMNIPLYSPFNNQTVNAVSMPNIVSINNSTITPGTNTILTNVTNTVTNQTANNNPLFALPDNVFYVLSVLYTIVEFVSGGFIWSSFTPFGFPPTFVYVLETAVGALMVRSVVYYTSGR
jgi:hypothetical protein